MYGLENLTTGDNVGIVEGTFIEKDTSGFSIVWRWWPKC